MVTYPMASRSHSPSRRCRPLPWASSSSAATTVRGFRASIRPRHRRHPTLPLLPALPLPPSSQRLLPWTCGDEAAAAAAPEEEGTLGSGGSGGSIALWEAAEEEDLARCRDVEADVPMSSGATRMIVPVDGLE